MSAGGRRRTRGHTCALQRVVMNGQTESSVSAMNGKRKPLLLVAMLIPGQEVDKCSLDELVT